MRAFLQIQPAFLICILSALFSITTLAQVSRSKNKSSNPYRGSYQRFSSGSASYSTFEIRDGALWAWGYNAFGQLGDGTSITKNTPTRIGTDTKWVSVSCGQYYTVGLKSDGTLWTWGFNAQSQLGDGTTANKNTPTQIGTDTKWVSISCGDAHTIALKSDGTLWAWGYNFYGQLGNGNTTDKNTPTQIGTDTKWMSVTCGNGYTIAIKSDGTLWTWGRNFYGQLGDGTSGSAANKSLPTQIGTDTKWVSIAGGYSHTIALKSDGTLWAWGYNGYGQLGDGTTTNKNTPTQIGTDTKWVTVSCGQYHTVALKSDGTLWTWGYNSNGQLGDGTPAASKSSPTQIGIDTKWVSIAGGYSHTIALKSDGTLWAWGYNAIGQLGDGTSTDRTTPLQVRTDPRNWIKVITGYHLAVAIKSDGTLWAWGDSVLGDNAGKRKSTPVQIGTDNKWVSIAGSGYHNLALKSDGTLWAWGFNGNGELGDSTTISEDKPIQVGSDNKWVNIACGAGHSMGLKSDGTLWAWGSNIFGQLGNGTSGSSTYKIVPTQIGADTKWTSITGGGSHSIALKSDGTLWAWGLNSDGQLGDGTTTNKTVPTQIGTDTKWVSVSGGGSHSIALKSDGTLWAWGLNSNGQLGDGTVTSKTVPTQIGTDIKWMSIAHGYTHSIALKSDGNLWAWGSNSFGELGDSTTTGRNIPTLINSQINVVALAGGQGNHYSAIIKADRSSICLTGFNFDGQLGDGTITNSSSYNCNNQVCRQYTLVTAASASYTQPLTGVANRTDFQAACALAAAVIPSGASPVSGDVTIQTFIDSSVQSYNGQPYVQRHYDILPSSRANTATATITLYFTQAEFTAYNTAAGTSVPKLPTGPADAAGIANLRVNQYHGTPTGGYAPGNYLTTWGGSGPAQVSINPADSNIVWNDRDSRWEVSFDITGFSGFFVSAASSAVLPVKLLSFTAYKADAQRNRLVWETAIETPGTVFTVERSSDGRTFTSVGNVSGKGTAGRYSFYDEQPLSSIAYYRLRITETDGGTTYSNIVVLSSGDHAGSLTVAPVPASSTIIITNTNAALNGTVATVSDMQGRIIYRFMLNGTGAKTVDISKWAAGIYTLKLASGEAIRMVKQ